MAAKLAARDIITEFDAQWNSGNVAEPLFVEVNKDGDPTIITLTRDSYIVARGQDRQIEPLGNWKYGHETYKVELEVKTRVSRQRLWDINDEIQRICFNRMHSLTNFQRIQYMGFTENLEDQINQWEAKIDLELVNSAVLLDST